VLSISLSTTMSLHELPHMRQRDRVEPHLPEERNHVQPQAAAFPDRPQVSASFLAEAMPVPSDRLGLYERSRYRMQQRSQRWLARTVGAMFAALLSARVRLASAHRPRP
jgi:hypothetical protein